MGLAIGSYFYSLTQNSHQTELITDEVDEMNHEGDTTIEYLPGVSESRRPSS